MNETNVSNLGEYSDKAIGMLGKVSLWIKDKFTNLGVDFSINLLMILIALIVLYFSSKITNKIVKVLIWIVSIVLLASGVYQILGGV